MSNLSNNGDPAGRMRRQATLMRIVNAPMRKILGLPFRTPFAGRLMLVTLTGRRTGKIYHQPVSYVRDADTLLTPGGGKWKLNLQPGKPETIPIPRDSDGHFDRDKLQTATSNGFRIIRWHLDN
jgi:hypothetical protein